MGEFRLLKKLLSALLMCVFFCSPAAAAEIFDIDMSATPIVEALRGLGYRSNRNIVINGELQGTVTLSLHNTNFEDCIDLLATTHNFTYSEKNGVVLVSPAKTMKQMASIRLDHLNLSSAKEQMKLLFDEDDIAINPETSTISVAGSTAQINQAREQLKGIDHPQPQIMVKTTVIELSKSKSRDLGFTYSTDPWGKDTSKSGYDGFKFLITAAHEESFGKSKLLARPSVAVFSGRKATILMGDEVPVFTSTSTSSGTVNDATVNVEYKDVGVKLEVVPRINDQDKETITMEIKPTISSITEWISSGNNTAPQISTREAETILRVKSGQTILLGGLLRDEIINTTKGVPLLSKLPFLGELFKKRSKSKDKTEILIALTPTIIHEVNGVPDVAEQKLTPGLHKTLGETQSEVIDNNIPKAEQDALDKENEKLQEQLQDKNKALKEKERLIKKLTKELNESSKTMKEFIKQNNGESKNGKQAA